MLFANEYQEMAARTINHDLTKGEQLNHALFGMASEVGELHGIYQKYYQGHELEEIHMKKELGDILWMVAEFCTVNDWKLEDVMHLNIIKLKARYPEKFDPERSLHRQVGDI